MNKKIVFMIVLIECFLAVLLIGVFGQAIFDAINKKAVTEIYFTYQDGTKIEDEVEYLQVELSDTVRDVQLYWTVLPDNASNQKVGFSCSRPESVIVSESGLVTFIDDIDVRITITTLDGSYITDTIVLVPKIEISGGGEL